MRAPTFVRAVETFGRERLSYSFFMRDFLHSEIASVQGMTNVPDDPDVAIAAGRGLCETLLEPLQDTFGRLHVRSSYRSPEVNAFGCRNRMSCASHRHGRGSTASSVNDHRSHSAFCPGRAYPAGVDRPDVPFQRARIRRVSSRTWRLADLGAKLSFLRAGLGWGSMPRGLIEADLASGGLVQLQLEEAQADEYIMPLSIIYPAAKPPGTAGRWLMERLKNSGYAG